MVGLEPDFDRERVADWLARNYSDEELAERILSLGGFRFSPRVEAELANALSAFGSVVLARELARNACSLDEFPGFCREAPPAPPGSAVIRSRGPSRTLMARLAVG